MSSRSATPGRRAPSSGRASRRVALANDPLNLLSVDAGANRQKGDGDAATWLPANKRFRCKYVARQVAVKQRYHAWVTQAEHDAIARVLATCPRRAAAQGRPDVRVPRRPDAQGVRAPTTDADAAEAHAERVGWRGACLRQLRGRSGGGPGAASTRHRGLRGQPQPRPRRGWPGCE